MDAASYCLLCPPGTFTSQNSSTSCERCGFNQYSSAAGSEFCSDCLNKSLPISAKQDAILFCSSTGNNSLCKLNNRCFDTSCTSGIVGRLVPGEAYNNNEQMITIIGAPEASQILLTFTSFMTEPDYDVVEVYSCNDILCRNSSLLSVLSGKAIPPPQISSTGLMQIKWTSEVCCPKPSSACFCDNPSNANILNGWLATFSLAGSTSCLECSGSAISEIRNCTPALRLHRGMTTQIGYKFVAAVGKDRLYEAVGKGKAVIPKKYGTVNKMLPVCTGTIAERFSVLDSIHKYKHRPILMKGSRLSTSFQDTRTSLAIQRRMSYSGNKNTAAWFSMCDETNLAAYGPCIASTYGFLDVFDVPTVANPMFPGINFQLGVIKKDAYDQTIITDSSSLIQVFAYETNTNQVNRTISVLGVTIVQLEMGVGLFSISIKPNFQEVSFSKSLSTVHGLIRVYFSGMDSEAVLNRMMHSTTIPVAFANGSDVCPVGYILDLDKVVHAGSDGSRSGTCTFCKPGTYSISPLKGAILNQDPSCLNCPIGGKCVLGGSNVTFAIGNWIAFFGLYLLVSCPRGFQLENKVDGSFSQDNQRCIMCNNNEYILNSTSSDYKCMKCPMGAICNGVTLQGVLPGSVWIPDYISGAYLLKACPAVRT